MAALTPTQVAVIASPGGEYVTKIFTVTPKSASDTVDLTTYFDSIDAVFGIVNAGQDANLMTAHCTNSSETVTIASLGADGGASTNWDAASITLTVVGTAYPQ